MGELALLGSVLAAQAARPGRYWSAFPGRAPKRGSRIEPTWLWADGLREAVVCVREDRPPLASLDHDLQLLDVVGAARVSAAERAAVPVDSSFEPLDLRLEPPSCVEHLHDHTRPTDEQ